MFIPINSLKIILLEALWCHLAPLLRTVRIVGQDSLIGYRDKRVSEDTGVLRGEAQAVVHSLGVCERGR